MTRTHAITGSAVALAAIAIAIMAASNEPTAERAIAPSPPTARESEAIDSPWDLPLERYAVDYPLYVATVGAILGNCVEESGYQYPLSQWDISNSEPATHTRLGHRDLTPEIAAQYGYRDAPDQRRVKDAPDIPVPDDAEYQRAFTACLTKAKSTIPEPAAGSDLLGRMNQASLERTQADKQVVSATIRWEHCMSSRLEELGINAGTPEELRGAVLEKEDARLNRGTVDTLSLEPSAVEKKIAIEDATCQHDAGLRSTYLRVLTQEQRNILERKPEEFQKLGRIAAAIDDAIQQTFG